MNYIRGLQQASRIFANYRIGAATDGSARFLFPQIPQQTLFGEISQAIIPEGQYLAPGGSALTLDLISQQPWTFGEPVRQVMARIMWRAMVDGNCLENALHCKATQVHGQDVVAILKSAARFFEALQRSVKQHYGSM